jgi:nucleoside-diphosphate-sugar epimerase
MRKVFITGSSGFIGGHVADIYIKNKFIVYGVDIKKSINKKNFFFYKCNLLNNEKLYTLVRAIKPEIVIHLAARTDLLGKKITDYKINYQGTKNLINICNMVQSVQRVVFASTLLVNKFPYKTNNLSFYDPDTIYGKSKVLMEKIVKSSNLKFEWCVIRPTTIWGDMLQNHFKLFFQLIKKNFYFHFGSKKIYKSYGYVKNTSFQIYKLSTCKLSQMRGKTFYLSDYIPICLNEFADRISLILNQKKNRSIPMFLANLAAYFGDLMNFFGYNKFPLQSTRLKNMTTDLVINQAKLKKLCGELPYNEEESLLNFINSYK